MSQLRTANLLGALAGLVVDRLETGLKTHPNQTDTSAAALNLIALHEGCSNLALSRALKLSHPATVRLVDRLKAAGLVDSRAAADRRAVSLHLTPAGRARIRAVLEARCAGLDSIVGVLSDEQRTQLDAIAETVLRAQTASPLEAAHICRLCDEIVCPPDLCPVHRKAATFPRGRR